MSATSSPLLHRGVCSGGPQAGVTMTSTASHVYLPAGTYQWDATVITDMRGAEHQIVGRWTWHAYDSPLTQPRS